MSFFNADVLVSGTDGLLLKDIGQVATTPNSGYGSLYVNDDVLYFKTDGGTSTNLLSPATSSANSFTAVQTITSDTDGEFVALKLINQSDAANTTGVVSLEFDLEDTGGTAVDAGKIAVKKNESFTSTASTQDSNMIFSTSLNGTLTEYLKLDSNGGLGFLNSGYLSSGYNVISVTATASGSAPNIQSSDITLPASSLFIRGHMIITTNITWSSTINIGLNIGTNSPSYNDIVNDSSNSIGFSTSSPLAADKVYQKTNSSGSSGSYLSSETTGIKFNLTSSGGNFSAGAVIFILEYIKL
jgi:hypothetical protein